MSKVILCLSHIVQQFETMYNKPHDSVLKELPKSSKYPPYLTQIQDSSKSTIGFTNLQDKTNEFRKGI